MLKCSFCELPLVCKACGQPFHPRHGDTHLAVYQPDMALSCPGCQTLLVCKACGYTYGEEEEENNRA